MDAHSPPFPLTCLYLYLADRCNLACGHCWISPAFSSSRGDGIPFATLRRVLLEARPLGLHSVKLTGGEPFLYREIDPLLDFLAAEGIRILIETNGTLLEEGLVAKLAVCPVDQISVSLDAATPERHDGLRGVQGAFARTLAGLRRLQARGLSFQVIMTLQRGNRTELPGLIALCRDLGAASLKINPLIPCGRGEALFRERENLDPAELLAIYRRLEDERPPGGGPEILFDLPAALRTLGDIQRRGLCECRILNILGILANGEYSLCGIGQTIDALRLGHIDRDPIVRVWQESPLLTDLRNRLPKGLKGVCGRCLFRFQCLGACRANAYTMHRDLFAPFFLCQEACDTGLFPASRLG